MLFPTNPRFLSLALANPQGDIDHVVDIHPSRWDTSIPIEEAILAILATKHRMHSSKTEMAWSAYPHYQPTVNHEHPDFIIQEGGISYHHGTLVEGTITIATTPTAIVFPDGRTFARATFSPYAYDHRMSSTERETLAAIVTGFGSPSAAPHMGLFLGNVLGALTACTGQPYFAWGHQHTRTSLVNMVGTVVGRIARLHAHCARSGLDAIRAGQSTADTLVNAAIITWALRPDRGYCPSTWVVSGTMRTMMDALDPVDVRAGLEGARALLNLAPTPHHLQAMLDATSAHATLQHKHLVQAIDRAVLGAYSSTPERLKPMAAKRAKTMVA